MKFKNYISSLSAKLLMAIIFFITISLSIYQLFQFLGDFLDQSEVGVVGKMICFGLIAVICAIGLFGMFMVNRGKWVSDKTERSLFLSTSDLSFLGARFLEGFIHGVMKPNLKETTREHHRETNSR